jgi:hypothetical protein
MGSDRLRTTGVKGAADSGAAAAAEAAGPARDGTSTVFSATNSKKA